MILPMDMPDDYPWLPGSGKSQLGDLGELAARLNSIVTYDRRGSVYWLDDFENGLSPWFVQTSGLDAAVDLVNTPTFRGDFAAKLTTGSSSWYSSGVLKRLAPALLTTYGFEATFSADSEIEYFQISFQKNNGVNKISAKIYINIDDQNLEYYDDAGDHVIIQDVIVEDADKYLFSTAKLVIDLTKDEYVRVQFNQLEIPLTGIPLYTTADATIPRLEVLFKAYGNSGENGIAYLDSVIVTIGDP